MTKCKECKNFMAIILEELGIRICLCLENNCPTKPDYYCDFGTPINDKEE